MAFTYGKGQVTKREYNLYIALSGDTIATINPASAISATNAAKIGVLAEQPKITTDKGEDVPLNTGAKIVISENITFEAILYEVTSANYEALRLLITTPDGCDIFLTDEKDTIMEAGTTGATGAGLLDGCTVTTAGAQMVRIEGMSIYPALEILGNGQNKITLSAELEAGVADANVTISNIVT